ncbi:unnamed protein product [Paramecium sonneborni]|uniref:Uncharacterized protein n=1 Tax=Paramecium sonneborni TaxID=65129 RepID=A0A8S1RCJ7_9CILI|nr:unnamed protein product [Paramecium sonneborni]
MKVINNLVEDKFKYIYIGIDNKVLRQVRQVVSNNKLINTLLLKQKCPSEYSPGVSLRQISLKRGLQYCKNTSIDLSKLTNLMKQQKVKQIGEGQKDQMNQLTVKARAIAMSAKIPQGLIHIRNDSAQVRKDNKEGRGVLSRKISDLKQIVKGLFTFEYVIGIGGFWKGSEKSQLIICNERDVKSCS